jgi:hypothetical protein
MNEPPTGIVRTLPSLYADPKSDGHRQYRATRSRMQRDPDATMAIALAQQPKHEVIHIYLVIGGKIDARFTLAGYEPGDSRECWDRTIRQPKVWAICAGIEIPPREIKFRGFQGIRYVIQPLW